MSSKGSRFSQEQIVRILRKVETDTWVAEQMVYRWRSKYGGLDTS